MQSQQYCAYKHLHNQTLNKRLLLRSISLKGIRMADIKVEGEWVSPSYYKSYSDGVLPL